MWIRASFIHLAQFVGCVMLLSLPPLVYPNLVFAGAVAARVYMQIKPRLSRFAPCSRLRTQLCNNRGSFSPDKRIRVHTRIRCEDTERRSKTIFEFLRSIYFVWYFLEGFLRVLFKLFPSTVYIFISPCRENGDKKWLLEKKKCDCCCYY